MITQNACSNYHRFGRLTLGMFCLLAASCWLASCARPASDSPSATSDSHDTEPAGAQAALNLPPSTDQNQTESAEVSHLAESTAETDDASDRVPNESEPGIDVTSSSGDRPETGEQQQPDSEKRPVTARDVADDTLLPTNYVEKLFENWPDPELALLVSGRQNGYLEPCGCTGLANQKGGLSRRHTMLQQLINRGWNMVPVDVGNQVRRSGRQPEIKFHVTIESLKKLDYSAVGLGPDDVRLSADELGAATIASEEEPSLVVSANTSVYAPELMQQFQITNAGGKKIGVTAILGDEHQRKISGDSIVFRPAEEGLKEIWPKLEAEQCDYYVLLAHTSLKETRRLANKFPDFDVIVTAGGPTDPPREVETINRVDTTIVQTGEKGMYVGVLGFFDDAENPIRYQRVPLDDRYEDSTAMLEIFKAYQDQLQTLGLEGLGLRPISHPTRGTFVGSEKCGECHDVEFSIWKDGIDGAGGDPGPHYHATTSLIEPGERSDIPRHFDPECLSCHVTGWNPQGFFPYKTGYLQASDLKLHGNGCENCHGPGREHVRAEEGEIDATDEEIQQIRAAVRLSLEEARKSKCYECHDLDNSPDFQVRGAFEEYWSQIEH